MPDAASATEAASVTEAADAGAIVPVGAVKVSDSSAAQMQDAGMSTPKQAGGATGKRKPSCDHEGSRSQYLVRSRQLKHKSIVFRYKASDDRSRQEAKVMADAKLAEWKQQVTALLDV